MIWNTKTTDFGTTKTVTRFAWRPVRLTSPENHVVWLQSYQQDVVYKGSRYDRHGRYETVYHWHVTRSYISDYVAQKPKRIDYYWPKAACAITSIVFFTQLMASAVTTPKPGFEWVLTAAGIAWVVALLWSVFAIAYNAVNDGT